MPAADTTPTFFWHDYETFGRVPRRDRPAQFAGLRTTLELEPVGEPVMWHCRPPTDQLPEPEAVLLTGITPQQALQRGLPEHEFAARIEAELGAGGTIGCGYNSLRFDDEVTRFLLWRNLRDPYGREWRNGCSRWDLLDTVRCCWALRPQGIEWPRHADGRPSFRLEDLTAANGLAHEGAHDALADVRATVALARLLRQRQPRLWDFCLKLRDKHAVWAEIGVQPRPFVHLSGRYPTERGCMAVVWPLAPHPTNRNELILWDLAQDPGELAALDADTVRRRLFTAQAGLPEGTARLPIKTIHVNKSPVVIGNLRVLGDAAGRWGMDLEQAQRHAAAAQALPDLRALWAQVFAREAQPHDADEALYDGFVGDDDRRRLERLLEQLRADPAHAAAPRRVAFDDERLDELAFRFRARNFPESLDDAERARWQAHRAARLHEGQGGATTLAQFQQRVDELAEQAAERGDERAEALLEALVDWAGEIAP